MGMAFLTMTMPEGSAAGAVADDILVVCGWRARSSGNESSRLAATKNVKQQGSRNESAAADDGHWSCSAAQAHPFY